MLPSFKDWLVRKPAGWKPRKPLRRVSAAKARDDDIYRAMLPGWKKSHPICEVCPVIKAGGFKVKCLGRTTHAHHVRGRRGPLLYDERYMLACCGGEAHPQWIHRTHPAEARKLGLLL